MSEEIKVCAHPECDTEFIPHRRGQRYCSAECGQAISKEAFNYGIEGSIKTPVRKKPMTEDEFTANLAKEKRKLEDQGIPVVNMEQQACKEKDKRIKAMEKREAERDEVRETAVTSHR